MSKKAPDFKLEDQYGSTQKLSDYSGQYVLLYFYPKDLTPGCTTEACGFRDNMNRLREADVQVIGVSADTVGKHKEFATKHSLKFPLLADTEKKVIEDYGVWKEKSFLGKKYMGISRESFLIDPKGMIVKHYEKVKPDDHPAEVLADVKALTKAAS